MKPPSFQLREFDGPLTRELVREPGRFGLGQLPKAALPVAVKKSICGFCSTGCGLKLHLDDLGHAINVTPDTDYPVNLGMACPKGWEALSVLDSADRATTPLLNGKPVDWDEALQVFCRRFQAIMDQHGPESVAWIGTGQIVNEELALLGALAKFGMGWIHGDGNTRQCMATAVAAYKECFGFDAPPFTYADFEESDVLVFVGANPCIAHPIMWQRVLRNKRHPRIVVIDPRTTETAMAATLHLPISPKSDLVLLYGLARQLNKDGALDRDFIAAHTTGFDDFAAHVESYTPEVVTRATGLSAEQFNEFARTVREGGQRVSFWWTMGVNQGHQATRTAQAIIALTLMTGNIGKPGTGANSITGQCNAMGSRLFSNTTNLLGGHDFTNAAHREKIARALGIPVERIPDRGSLPYHKILEGVERGKIKGLWIIATNPFHSWIDQNAVPRLADKLDFLVVQDPYTTTETARQADLLLPAAAWAEKDGTFINSERRIGLNKKVRRAPGQALSDFRIFQLIAHYWGCGEMFARWSNPAAVFELLKECSRGQPCDITGIENCAMLEELGGVQWPCPERVAILRPEESRKPEREVALRPEESREPPRQERRLFADGKFFTPDGRARFVFEKEESPAELPCAEYPLTLLTGRGTSSQWHTETRTAKSAILRKLAPAELLLDIHPADAALSGIADHAAIRVASRRGELTARARHSETVARGQVFFPMHHPAVNRLTYAAFDPLSHQPSYKHCAVRVEPA